MLRLVSVSLSVSLSLSISLLAGCGSGGGSCAPACGQKGDCGQVGSNLTALAALAAGKTAAAGGLAGPPRWMAGIQGLQITRDGLPSMTPTTQIGNVTIYTSGWVFKYCSGMEELGFGAGPPTSTVEKGCGNIDCTQLADYAPPAVDSPQAIAAAFPSDPAGTLYSLQAVFLGTSARVWQVTKSPNGPTVKIDADTGAVVP